jgi:hypothetical protein
MPACLALPRPVGGNAEFKVWGFPVREERDRYRLARECHLVPGAVAPTGHCVAIVVAPTSQTCVEKWEKRASIRVRTAHVIPF